LTDILSNIYEVGYEKPFEIFWALIKYIFINDPYILLKIEVDPLNLKSILVSGSWIKPIIPPM
jgi:hypothetical protein